MPGFPPIIGKLLASGKKHSPSSLPTHQQCVCYDNGTEKHLAIAIPTSQVIAGMLVFKQPAESVMSLCALLSDYLEAVPSKQTAYDSFALACMHTLMQLRLL